jgi:hypothetical protein
MRLFISDKSEWQGTSLILQQTASAWEAILESTVPRRDVRAMQSSAYHHLQLPSTRLNHKPRDISIFLLSISNERDFPPIPSQMPSVVCMKILSQFGSKPSPYDRASL